LNELDQRTIAKSLIELGFLPKSRLRLISLGGCRPFAGSKRFRGRMAVNRSPVG